MYLFIVLKHAQKEPTDDLELNEMKMLLTFFNINPLKLLLNFML